MAWFLATAFLCPSLMILAGTALGAEIEAANRRCEVSDTDGSKSSDNEAAMYSFGPYRLEPGARRLLRDGETVALGDHQFDVLVQLVSHAGSVISKDALIEAAWPDVAVTDNSLEQAISALRRTLGSPPGGDAYIQTIARRGYRFTAEVSRVARRESDEVLDALLAPYRAWLEGRAALETLAADQVAPAQQAFERVLDASPDYAFAHIGLANACAFRFESTRADERPDTDSLARAVQHAGEACRLDAGSAEAWATLGFVLHRAGRAEQALAASRRAVSLEPGNWRHQLRLGFVSWGEERLRAAARTLQLLPGIALPHWLAATVFVARQAFDSAERELDAGAAAQNEQGMGMERFGAVGLHWLLGLVRLQRGAQHRARDAFERELSFEHSGHLYVRECCANTWYAIGALSLREGNDAEAARAVHESLRRVPGHLPSLALQAARSNRDDSAADRASLDARLAAASGGVARVEAAVAAALREALEGRHREAASLVEEALATAPQGSAGWVVPVEPLLQVFSHQDVWARVLAALRSRAA
jgi:DNA-binding winged helix-turn-helix (wHTH) protein